MDIEAAGSRPRPSLHRSNSNLSIHSMHSRRGSIDPASALPIQYRTVSFQIAESKEKNAVEIQKAKDNAAKGTVRSNCLDCAILTNLQNSRTLTGTQFPSMKYILDFPAQLVKDCPQTKSSVVSRSSARTNLLLRPLTTFNKSSDTSSKDSDLFYSLVPSSSSYHGNLSVSLPQSQTWLLPLFFSLCSLFKQHSMPGKTGLLLVSWLPSRPCFPTTV